jgi:hypothetical protein
VVPIPAGTLTDFIPKDGIVTPSGMRFETVVFLPAAPEKSGELHE